MKTALAPRAGLPDGNSERANDRFCSVRPMAGGGGDCRTQRSRQDDVLPLASGRCRVAVRQRRPPGRGTRSEALRSRPASGRIAAPMLDQGESFIFETVFSDPVGEKIGFLEEATRRGYTVVLCYIGLADSQQSIERVAMRVLQGGHNVPVKKLRERYARSLNNLRGGNCTIALCTGVRQQRSEHGVPASSDLCRRATLLLAGADPAMAWAVSSVILLKTAIDSLVPSPRSASRKSYRSCTSWPPRPRSSGSRGGCLPGSSLAPPRYNAPRSCRNPRS